MRHLIFLVQWPFDPSHPSLFPIDNIMYYQVYTLCCGLQLAGSLSGNSTSSPHSRFGRWQTSLPLGPAANVITPHCYFMSSSVEGNECQYDNLWYSLFLSYSQNSCLPSLIAMEKTAISSHAVVSQWVDITSNPFIIWYILAIKSWHIQKN